MSVPAFLLDPASDVGLRDGIRQDHSWKKPGSDSTSLPMKFEMKFQVRGQSRKKEILAQRRLARTSHRLSKRNGRDGAAC